MTLEEKITEWNGGVSRGAAARFAREVKADPGLVSRWLKGAMPSEPHAVKICRLLDVAPRELELMISESRIEAQGATMVRDQPTLQITTESPIGERSYGWFTPGVQIVEVPIVGRVAASGIDYAPDEPPRVRTPFPLYGPMRGTLQALVVSGDSMEPTAPDGSYIILKSREFFRSGKLAVVRVDGQVLLKRVIVEGDVIVLESDNKKHKPRRYSAKQVEILAAVHSIVTVREE